MKSCAEEMASNIEIERKQGLKLFYSLSEDEQEGVLSIVSRTAMQNYTEDAPLRSLIDLSNKGNLNAAKSFSKCIERIRTANLGAGLGITLRSFNVEHGNRAAEIIGDIKDKLAKTETKIGRAIKKRKRGKP
jgi:hypothetical protein